MRTGAKESSSALAIYLRFLLLSVVEMTQGQLPLRLSFFAEREEAVFIKHFNAELFRLGKL